MENYKIPLTESDMSIVNSLGSLMTALYEESCGFEDGLLLENEELSPEAQAVDSVEPIEGDGEDPMEGMVSSMPEAELNSQDQENISNLSAESANAYKEGGQGVINPEDLLKIEIAQTEATVFTLTLYEKIDKTINIIDALLMTSSEDYIVKKLNKFLEYFKLLRDIIFDADINTMHYTYSTAAIHLNNFIKEYVRKDLKEDIRDEVEDGNNKDAKDVQDDLNTVNKLDV